jgi:PPOX class probable F420-dependent enzyme
LIAIPTDNERSVILSSRVARMATADKSGSPLVIPVCFAYDGRYIYTPIDKKPKRVDAWGLKRIRNILENPRLSLVMDEYSEDWSRLYYLIIHGSGEVIRGGDEYQNSFAILSVKYPQYKKMRLEEEGLPVIKIVPEKIVSWGVRA